MAGEDNYDKIIAYIFLVVLLPFSRVASYSALFRSPFPRLRGMGPYQCMGLPAG
jgi:hypothetical protein